MTYWTLGFIAALVVVLVVAALLIGILWQAMRIKRLALAASDLVSEIDANTRSVWSLGKTNLVAGQILDGAEAIEANAGAIVQAVAHDTPTTDAAR